MIKKKLVETPSIKLIKFLFMYPFYGKENCVNRVYQYKRKQYIGKKI